MRLSTFISPAVLALAALTAAGETSDVISLTSANFESTVNPEPLILVEFFAPWCGHCKALAPHYEEAATAISEKNIKLAKVDCVEEPDLCQTHGVQGYPTLKVFRDGVPSEYTGPRKADGIISYMIKQSLPAVGEVTAANHQEFQKSDKIVVIAYLNSPTDDPVKEFKATAEKHRDNYLFGISTDPEAIAAASVTPPAIVVFRQFDEPRVDYPYPVASSKLSDIERWVKDLAIPFIDEVSGDNYAAYAQSGKPLSYLFLDPTDEKKEEHINIVKGVAEKYYGKVNFVWIDAIKFGDHARSLNLQEVHWPSFVIHDIEKQLKYPYDQTREITSEGVGDWVAQFVDGKLVPQLKSQPVPESQNENVTTVVGKNFEEIVYDDAKDVFLELYATWCGHCKRLKPIWDSLADRFAHVKDRLVIAKMDAPENDLPASIPFRVSGFPTLKFRQAGSREFIDYDGDRSLESLVAFVEKHAKNSLEPKVQVQAEPEKQVPLAQETMPETASPQSTAHDEHDEL